MLERIAELGVNLRLVLGMLYRSQGLASRARRFDEQAVAVVYDQLGPEHPGTLISMNNPARTLHASGDTEGAKELHEQTVEARRRTLVPEHPDTLASMNNLAGTLHALGDVEGAKQAIRGQMAPKGNGTPTGSDSP